jgi:hypothetical protein
MLPGIARENNFDFHHRTGGIWQASLKYPDQPGASTFCRKNNFSLEQLDVSQRNPNYYKSDLDEDNG